VATVNWNLVLAGAQAVAALAIAALTFYLVRFTRDYVREMKQANQLQAQANSLIQLNMAREMAARIPFLVAAAGGRKVSDKEVVGELTVRNAGNVQAHDITVETTWGPVTVAEPLPPGQGKQVDVRIPPDRWQRGTDPQVVGFKFRNIGDQWFEQEVGQLPVMKDDVSP
jgi:hypothetical protein